MNAIVFFFLFNLTNLSILLKIKHPQNWKKEEINRRINQCLYILKISRIRIFLLKRVNMKNEKLLNTTIILMMDSSPNKKKVKRKEVEVTMFVKLAS